MRNYQDTVRPALARVQSWRTHLLPDPLNSTDDAEHLRSWWLARPGVSIREFHGQAYSRVTIYRNPSLHPTIEGNPKHRIASSEVGVNQEADSGRRRRRALVMASWLAIQEGGICS